MWPVTHRNWTVTRASLARHAGGEGDDATSADSGLSLACRKPLYQRALSFSVRCWIRIDVHDAEAPRVAPGPFEVVEQRPGEVATHRPAGRHRPLDGGHVLDQVAGPIGVSQATVARRRIGIRRAIFGDRNYPTGYSAARSRSSSNRLDGWTTQPIWVTSASGGRREDAPSSASFSSATTLCGL